MRLQQIVFAWLKADSQLQLLYTTVRRDKK